MVADYVILPFGLFQTALNMMIPGMNYHPFNMALAVLSARQH